MVREASGEENPGSPTEEGEEKTLSGEDSPPPFVTTATPANATMTPTVLKFRDINQSQYSCNEISRN